jgi:hypothetical protein
MKLASYQETEMADIQDLIKQEKAGIVVELWLDETPIPKIAKYTKFTEEEVIKIIEQQKNKDK